MIFEKRKEGTHNASPITTKKDTERHQRMKPEQTETPEPAAKPAENKRKLAPAPEKDKSSSGKIIKWSAIAIVFLLIINAMIFLLKEKAPVAQPVVAVAEKVEDPMIRQLQERLVQIETEAKAKAEADAAALRDRDREIEATRESAKAVLAQVAEAEAKATAKAEAEAQAKAVEIAELEAERLRGVARLQAEVFDPSKNWTPHGHIQVANVDAFKERWGGWIEFEGYHFPLLKNNHNLPGPVKGDMPPDFLTPPSLNAKWEMRKITLKNPNGAGQYSTTGWASSKKPVSSKN